VIPPNVGPPKTIVVTHPGAEGKLREQLVYLVHLSAEEVARLKLVPGNRLIIRFRDDIVGEGQAILVERTTLERITKYDAIQAGFEDATVLQKHILATVLAGAKKPERTEFYKVLYRWL